MFAEASIIDGWKNGSLIYKFFNHDDPGIINVAPFIGLDFPLGINNHLISDLDLLTKLTKLHLLNLQLQFRLLLLPLELQVLDQDNVFFKYVSKKLTGELLVPGLLPFPCELISTFHQGYHLSVVVIKLCLQLTQLCVSLIDLLLKELSRQAVLPLVSDCALHFVLLGHQTQGGRLHLLLQFVNAFLSLYFLYKVSCELILRFLQRLVAKCGGIKDTLVTKGRL